MTMSHKMAEEFRPVITEMLSSGATYQDIANAIDKSRNAVASMVRRLGLSNRNPLARAKGWKARRVKMAAPLPVGPIGDFPSGRTCRHPVNDEGQPFQCCGHEGYPYCSFHAARNHVRKEAA